MSEKLTASITFKCTDDEKVKLEAIARTKKLNLSEFIRSISKVEISVVEELLHSLQKEFGITTDTRDTFELTQPVMMIDVTPKPQAQKKPNCCDQLSFLAVHTEI